jgi:hypothetical protein
MLLPREQIPVSTLVKLQHLSAGGTSNAFRARILRILVTQQVSFPPRVVPAFFSCFFRVASNSLRMRDGHCNFSRIAEGWTDVVAATRKPGSLVNVCLRPLDSYIHVIGSEIVLVDPPPALSRYTFADRTLQPGSANQRFDLCSHCFPYSG